MFHSFKKQESRTNGKKLLRNVALDIVARIKEQICRDLRRAFQIRLKVSVIPTISVSFTSVAVHSIFYSIISVKKKRTKSRFIVSL